MREILFKGKCLKTKEWFYGYYYNGNLNNPCLIDKDVSKIHHEVIPDTLGQYTGLKDKNGNKISEGDIVRWDDMSNGEKWRVAVVEFNPDIQFRIIRIECDFIQSAKEGYVFRFGSFIYKDTHNHLEVIGNIHDNEK